MEPLACWYHNYENAYTPDSFIVYRVLINPDGSRQILDVAQTHDDVHNYYPVYYHSLSASVPEKALELTEPGNYRVELRKIDVPRATANNNPGVTPDSTVDWWVAERVKPGIGVTCTVNWNDNDCWTERKTESDMKLSDKSQLLEYYEITVATPIVLPDAPEGGIDRSSMNIVSVGSPFEQNKGTTAEPDAKAQAAEMALTGILAVGAVGAGAYLYRSYTTSTGSSFKAYQTEEGRANEAAVLVEKEKIRRMDEEYAEKMRQYNLKKKREQAAALALAMLTSAGKKKTKNGSAAEQQTAYDKKSVAALSFTAGPTAAMVAPTGFVEKEETVSRGAFNFFDALNLKEQYGYTMADALAVAYEKNKVVNAIGDLASTIEEGQMARIAEADKYPWPISSAVKFAASFTKETAAAVTALIGNGFFAAGATATMLFDSAVNLKDAGGNFAAMGEMVMGSLFRSARYVGSTIKNEDVEVSAGMLMSFAIAPEEAVLERGEEAVRISRLVGKAEKTAAKVARREADIGMEISERTAIKSMETGDVASLAELMEARTAGETVSAWGKTFIQVSELNTENK